MSDWKAYNLGEIAEIKYGKDHKHLDDGSVPVYGSGGVMRYVNTAIYEKESILIPRKGTLSNLFYINKPFWSVDTMFYTKIKEGTNVKFLYYLLKGMDLASLNVGSAVPSLTTEVLKRIEVNLPDLFTQNEIASILSSLDDKIELNLQMNKTLEALAQAIYKEWFIDFRFPGFNGELVDGLPKGWKNGTLGEIISVHNGFAFKSDDFKNKGDNGIIKIKNISSNVVDIINVQYIENEIAERVDAKFNVSSQDLLIAMTGAEVGKVGIVPQNDKNLWLNQRVGLFREKVKFAKWFCYLILSSKEYQNRLLNTASGSAQPNISSNQIEGIEIILPARDKIGLFGEIVNPFFNRMTENCLQNQILVEIRDTLLPNLMTGKIRVA